jgi:hypothetical protein
MTGTRNVLPVSFSTAKDPLTLNMVSNIVLSLTELALVNFNGPVRTTDLNFAALQKDEHGFSAEHAPVCDRVVTEAIFAFYLVGRFVTQDVVCKLHNFVEGELTMLEPCLMDVDVDSQHSSSDIAKQIHH